jgi:GT2 family glycosyltransferase
MSTIVDSKAGHSTAQASASLATVTPPVVVVIPNWNGVNELAACIDSVLLQTLVPHLIVVDNGSVDGSIALIETYPHIELIKHRVNKGYAGGVNPGFRRAIELGAAYVAPFNNDAVADKDWLIRMVEQLDAHPELGIVTCKVATSDGSHLDSTGDYYTTWGLAYPRGRGEVDRHQYDSQTDIFAASGAASLYRVSMLEQIGLLDEDFFAYYEDVDLSFRAQLSGWKVAYVPTSVVYHEQGTTSKRMGGFSTYQTIKNYPWLLIRNVPGPLLAHILPRFLLAYGMFVLRGLTRWQIQSTLKGIIVSLWFLPKKIVERHRIQRMRTVRPDYIWRHITHDLPPNATSLRRLRTAWWKLTGRKSI